MSPAHSDWQPHSAGFAILTPISAARLAPAPLRWICNPAWLPVAVSAGEVLSQMSCRKAKLKFSSPGGTMLRPFQGLWLVPMEPNWVQQDHQAALHRSRTAVPGTNEFQVRQNSQLQHKYVRINRMSEKTVEGRTEQICKLTQDLLLWCRARAAGSSAEGSPRARPEQNL